MKESEYTPEVCEAVREAVVMTGGNGIGGEQLRRYIERIERLAEEKSALTADIRDVFAEAKGNGFEPKTMREIIRLRKMESHEREEQEELLDLYKRALGMTGTPLADAGFTVEPKAAPKVDANRPSDYLTAPSPETAPPA